MEALKTKSKSHHHDFQCRVCLSDGAIPIFGEEEDADISEDIMLFGGIMIDEEDDYPKHICDACFQLLMSALVFRNVAKHSDKLLKSAIDNESINSDTRSNKTEASSDTHTVLHLGDNDTESMVSFIVDSDVPNTEQDEGNDNESVLMVIDNQTDIDDMSVSGQDTTYHCDLCNSEYHSLAAYRKHISTKQHYKLAKELGKTNCEICNYFVPDKIYENHCQMHKADEADSLNMLECTTCDLKFDTMEEFEEHCNTEMHQNSFKHNSRQPNTSNIQKIKCTICEKYITKSYFKMHLKIHGNQDEKNEMLQQCPYCKKHFVYSYLRAHIQRIHTDQPVDVGNKTKKHRNPSYPEYICDKCGKVFKKKSNLNLHILTHGSDFQFKCMFCPYRGLHAGLLKIHIRTHTKDYNYKCTQCPAKFLTKSNLNKHLQRHKGVGDFQCDLCDKHFYSKTELNQHHEAVHLGIKNHICDICGKAFSCRNYMMCHQLKFHKRKRLTDGKGRLPNYLANNINDSNVENQSDIDV